MRRLKVGLPLQQGATDFEEGVHYNYTPGGHMLTLSRKNPGRSEIHDVQRAQSTFALRIANEALFLLARFGDCPWRVAHYNWWINPPIMRPDPLTDLQSLDGGVSVSVCLVNASDGIVEALRAVRLPYRFSYLLVENVELQSRHRFDPYDYLATVEDAKRKYPDGSSMVADAICVCTADFELADRVAAPISCVLQ